ncbi:DUF6576 domain-containing protein [Pontimicrobium sp. MEBiC01747]|jgi:hypothetical protein
MAIILVILLIAVFVYFLTKKTPVSPKKKHLTIDDKYNEKRVKNEKELNKLLEKINKKGINSLSKKEKARLDELSK